MNPATSRIRKVIHRELRSLFAVGITERQWPETAHGFRVDLGFCDGLRCSLERFAHVSDQTVSHYRIVEKVGAGGMGVVYRAHDDRLNRDVALKFLPDELNHDENARALLIREARTASALNHPNICTIYDVGEADGKSYIVMEFVSGRSLAEQIPEDGLPVETVICYGEQIADAMAHAHERGVIHRDLKTPNVIVMPGGRVKVLDFGLAKHLTPGEITLKTQSISTLTSEGAIVGTMHYMAPELFRGEPADARSDVWALGVVLYEMANGKRPFRGRTSYELSSMILHDSPPPLRDNVPLGLRSVIEHCLAKEPAQRYQHASEIRAALEALRTNSAVIPASAIQASVILPSIPAPRSRLRSRGPGFVGRGGVATDNRVCLENWWREVARDAGRGRGVHSIAGRASAGKSHWRSETGLFRRWNVRRADHRAFADQETARHLAHFGDAVQRQARKPRADRSGIGRGRTGGRLGAAFGRSCANFCGTGTATNGPESLGAQLRTHGNRHSSAAERRGARHRVANTNSN